jgi:drug/metabolite transporter (DMT)-like permease
MMPEAPVRKVREAPVPREDWHAKDEPRAPIAHAGPSGNQMVDPEDFWGEVKHFVLDLSLADKLAFLGSVAALISCFFPWKDTITEGEILGLMSLGAAVFGVSVLIIIAIVVRVRKVMPALHALIPWLIQFGGACFCIVWCLVYVKLSWDSTMARSPIGNFERWVSSPSPGVFIALLMSVMTLGGTLMGLKEKPTR